VSGGMIEVISTKFCYKNGNKNNNNGQEDSVLWFCVGSCSVSYE